VLGGVRRDIVDGVVVNGAGDEEVWREGMTSKFSVTVSQKVTCDLI
jgi:hypothetical protein